MAVANGNGQRQSVLAMAERSGDLFASREAYPYNAAEQEFSRYVEARLEKLLRGDLNRLALLRHYHQQPDRLAAPIPPRGVDRNTLRIPVVEEMLVRVLVFLQTGMPGGPIAQESANGRIVERQLHTTRFPHILIERIDSFETGSGTPLETEWILKRTQNQQVATRINRVLDLANLSLEFFRASR
jgi:hypothetical protein